MIERFIMGETGEIQINPAPPSGEVLPPALTPTPLEGAPSVSPLEPAASDLTMAENKAEIADIQHQLQEMPPAAIGGSEHSELIGAPITETNLPTPAPEQTLAVQPGQSPERAVATPGKTQTHAAENKNKFQKFLDKLPHPIKWTKNELIEWREHPIQKLKGLGLGTWRVGSLLAMLFGVFSIWLTKVTTKPFAQLGQRKR